MKLLKLMLLLWVLIHSVEHNAQVTIDFSNKNDVDFLETPYVKVTKEGLMFEPEESSYYYTLPFQLNQSRYSASFNFNITENKDAKMCGLLIHLKGGHQYRFFYYDKGKYLIKEIKNSEKSSETLVKWTEHNTIKKGVNQVNKLTLESDEEKIHFIINGTHLHSENLKGSAEIDFIQVYSSGKIKFNISNAQFSDAPIIRPIKVVEQKTALKEELYPFHHGINHPEFSVTTCQISADEKHLFFTRKTTIKDKTWDRVLHAKRRRDGSWEPAMYMDTVINKYKSHTSPMSVNTNGTVLFTRGGYIDGKYNNGGVQKFENRLDDTWELKQVMTVDNYSNKSNHIHQFLSNDENYLLSVIDKGDGIGRRDIHVSFKKDDENYSEPLNLGPTINSSSDEVACFLAPDNVTLYFSTSGLPGYGDVDIFMAKRLDDSWQSWSTPINLGPVFNSAGWDGYFSTSASGNMAVVTSSFGRKNTSLFYYELDPSVKPNPVVVVSGIVTDKDNNSPLGAHVVFNSLSGKVSKSAVSNSKTGAFSIVLLSGEKYEILANEKDYFPIAEFLDLTELENFEEVEKNLQLAKIRTGQVIRLNNLFFDFGKASLTEDSYNELNRLVKLLEDQPSIKIEIAGHTDAIGSDESNKTLSQNRSNSVKEYLINKGVSTNRLISKGYGKTDPVADNDTEEGRAMNRRVEFKIL
jgi:outer membrane protein OmpA-like peptidoglycan-associated protein